MTTRTCCVRCLMVVLVLNISWAEPLIEPLPDPIPAPPPEPYADCGPVPLDLAARQQAVYAMLGWGNYDVCQDMFLLIDEDVYGGDPEHVFTGSRDEFTPFSFTVSDYVAFADWESYGLSQSVIDDICAANAVAGVFLGTINSNVEVVALTISTDDPLGVLPRTHALLVLDGGQAPRAPGDQCDCDTPDPTGLYICCAKAEEDHDACYQTAKNDFHNCLYNDCAIAGGIGGLVGCLVKSTKWGGVMGPAAIKGMLIACGLGALVGIALAAWRCYNTLCNDRDNCDVKFNSDRNKCMLQYC